VRVDFVPSPIALKGCCKRSMDVTYTAITAVRNYGDAFSALRLCRASARNVPPSRAKVTYELQREDGTIPLAMTYQMY
jgi:hypothetical protein